jgi:spermidine/putrescine transport system substrate-binding protein
MKEHWTLAEIELARKGMASRRQILTAGSAAIAGAFMAPFFPDMAKAEVGGELKLLAWETMPMQEFLADFLKTNNITLNVSSIATQDDVQVQLVGNTPTVIDVTSYSVGYEDYYRKQLAIVSTLDKDKVPNYNSDDIFPEFFMQPTWALDGELYAVPVIWGLNSLVYNPALVPEPKSYKDLLKPEYAGQLTFIEDTIATWPMIARIAGLGDKFPKLTTDELAAAFEAAKPYRAQSKLFAGSIGDTINLFVNKEIGVMFCGWAGMPMETGAQGVETIAVVPEEGGAMWCDAWFIPKTAVNRDTAHAYINELVGPAGNAAMANKHVCGTVNRKSVELLDENTRAQVNYDNIAEVLRKSPIAGMPPRESGEFATFDQWTAAWEDFKLGF